MSESLRRRAPTSKSPRMQIECIPGDITGQEVDAVVNAANASLLGGGGVDGAIHRRGGPSILEECRDLRATVFPDGLPVGDAVATTAGNLPARWVIHTVGPVHSRHEDHSAALRRCYVSALEIADELGARSVAFPAVSAGTYGWPIRDAAKQALTAVWGARTTVDLVRFVLRGKPAFEAFDRAMRS